jgi:hypothetical protein
MLKKLSNSGKKVTTDPPYYPASFIFLTNSRNRFQLPGIKKKGISRTNFMPVTPLQEEAF